MFELYYKYAASLTKSKVLLSLLMSSLSSYGAGLVIVETDATGAFIASDLGTASWSGGGMVQSNISETSGDDTIIVANGTSGTFTFGNFGEQVNAPFEYVNAVDLLNPLADIGVSLSINITATSSVAGPSTFNIVGDNYTLSSQGGRWRGIVINNLVNVETLSVEFVFGSPLAALRGGSTPWLAALGMTAGTSNFDATYNINGLSVNGASYDGTGTFGNTGFNSFTHTTGSGSITNQGVSSNFYGVSNLDIDGGGVSTLTLAQIGDGITQEIERTYATGGTWVITESTSSVFTTDSEFRFSFNGAQYSDPVPEPSSILLCAFGALLSLGYRRRKSL